MLLSWFPQQRHPQSAARACYFGMDVLWRQRREASVTLAGESPSLTASPPCFPPACHASRAEGSHYQRLVTFSAQTISWFSSLFLQGSSSKHSVDKKKNSCALKRNRNVRIYIFAVNIEHHCCIIPHSGFVPDTLNKVLQNLAFRSL